MVTKITKTLGFIGSLGLMAHLSHDVNAALPTTPNGDYEKSCKQCMLMSG